MSLAFSEHSRPLLPQPALYLCQSAPFSPLESSLTPRLSWGDSPRPPAPWPVHCLGPQLRAAFGGALRALGCERLEETQSERGTTVLCRQSFSSTSRPFTQRRGGTGAWWTPWGGECAFITAQGGRMRDPCRARACFQPGGGALSSPRAGHTLWGRVAWLGCLRPSEGASQVWSPHCSAHFSWSDLRAHVPPAP